MTLGVGGPLDEKKATWGAAIGISLVLYITALGSLPFVHPKNQMSTVNILHIFSKIQMMS